MAAPVYRGGRPFIKPGVRTGNNTGVFNIAGAPVNGTSGTLVGVAGPGSLLMRTNGSCYINTNTKASPTWSLLGSVLSGASLVSPVVTGKPTTYSTVTTYTGASDAIDISLGDIFMLSRAGAADAATLADPAVGDNGRIIRIFSGTAFAHTITITNGIGGAGGTDDVITFTNRISASITLFAHATKWYVVGANLAAIA